jgi:hypothetical protein
MIFADSGSLNKYLISAAVNPNSTLSNSSFGKVVFEKQDDKTRAKKYNEG